MKEVVLTHKANRVREMVDDLKIDGHELARLMIDLQRRSERGEDASRLIAALASDLRSRRIGPRR